MSVSKQTVGSLFVLLSAAGFGTLPILVNISLATELNIPTILVFRFGIGLMVVCSYIYFRHILVGHPRDNEIAEQPPQGQSRFKLPPKLTVVSVGLGAFGYALISWLFFIGVNEINAGLATILLYTYPLFVVWLGVLLLNESVTRRKLAAVLLTLSGIGLVSGASFDLINPFGLVATVGAAVLYAFYIVISRKTLATVDELILTVYVLLGAVTSCFLIGILTGQVAVPTDELSWMLLISIGIFSTGVPIFAFFAGLKRISAGKAGILATAEPVIAVALGAVVLNEQISAVAYFGGFCVTAGVILIEYE